MNKFEIETEEIVKTKYHVEAETKDEAQRILAAFIQTGEFHVESAAITVEECSLTSWEIKSVDEII